MLLYCYKARNAVRNIENDVYMNNIVRSTVLVKEKQTDDLKVFLYTQLSYKMYSPINRTDIEISTTGGIHMPEIYHGQPEIQCPFYTGKEEIHAGKKIFCESPVPGSSLSLYFREKQAYQSQLRIFCCQHYKKCEIYRAVMEAKYDD